MEKYHEKFENMADPTDRRRQLIKIVLVTLMLFLSGTGISEIAIMTKCKGAEKKHDSLSRSFAEDVPSVRESTQKVPDDVLPKEVNHTECYPLKQYSIPLSRKRVTVCNDSERGFVDFRKFINDKPTIQGIQFSLHEWDNLYPLLIHVNWFIKQLYEPRLPLTDML